MLDKFSFAKLVQAICTAYVSLYFFIIAFTHYKLLPAFCSHTWLVLLANLKTISFLPDTCYGIYISRSGQLFSKLQFMLAEVFKQVNPLVFDYYLIILKLLLFVVLWYVAGNFIETAEKEKTAKLFIFILIIGMFIFSPAARVNHYYAYPLISLSNFQEHMGIATQGLIFLIFVLWLKNYRPILLPALLFIVTLIHPTNGFFLGAIIILFETIQFLIDKKRTWKDVLLKIVPLILALTPMLGAVLGLTGQENAGLINPLDRYNILKFVNAPHIFPWDINSNGVNGIFLLLAFLTAVPLFVSAVFKNSNKQIYSKLFFTFLFSVGVIIINFILLGCLKSFMLGGDKLLSRVYIFIGFMYQILFPLYLLAVYRKKAWPEFMFLLSVYLGYLTGSLENVYPLLFSSFWLSIKYFKIPFTWRWSLVGIAVVLVLNFMAIENAKDLALFMVFLFLFFGVYIKQKYYNGNYDTEFIGGFVLIMGLIILMRLVVFSYSALEERQEYRTKYAGVSEWLQRNTPKDAVLLAPYNLNGLSPLFLYRNVIFDNAIWGAGNYYPELLLLGVKAFKNIYDLDILKYVGRQGARHDDLFIKLLDNSYQRISANRLRLIKRNYPEAAYFLYPCSGETSKLVLDRRYFGTAQSVYADKYFILYNY